MWVQLLISNRRRAPCSKFPRSSATRPQKGHCGIQQGSDMAATNPATDTTLPNVRLAENFNDSWICTDRHFTVPWNCFTWAVCRIPPFLKYPQRWSITSKVTQCGALSSANVIMNHGYRTCPSQKKLESASFFLSACSSQRQDCQLLPQGMVRMRSPHVPWPGGGDSFSR